MTDIPDDVMTAARNVVADMMGEATMTAGMIRRGLVDTFEPVQAAVRAILSEREASKSRERAAWVAGRDAAAHYHGKKAVRWRTEALRHIRSNGRSSPCRDRDDRRAEEHENYAKDLRALEPPAEFGPDEIERLNAGWHKTNVDALEVGMSNVSTITDLRTRLSAANTLLREASAELDTAEACVRQGTDDLATQICVAEATHKTRARIDAYLKEIPDDAQ